MPVVYHNNMGDIAAEAFRNAYAQSSEINAKAKSQEIQDALTRELADKTDARDRQLSRDTIDAEDAREKSREGNTTLRTGMNNFTSMANNAMNNWRQSSVAQGQQQNAYQMNQDRIDAEDRRAAAARDARAGEITAAIGGQEMKPYWDAHPEELARTKLHEGPYKPNTAQTYLDNGLTPQSAVPKLSNDPTWLAKTQHYKNMSSAYDAALRNPNPSIKPDFLEKLHQSVVDANNDLQQYSASRSGGGQPDTQPPAQQPGTQTAAPKYRKTAGGGKFGLNSVTNQWEPIQGNDMQQQPQPGQ